LSFALLSSTAHAVDRIGLNYNIHQNYISTRAMGMGNAFTAVADDYNVLYYNPAGLAFLKQKDLNLKLEASGTPALLGFANELSDDLKKPEADQPNAINDTFTRNFGQNFNFRPVIGGTLVKPGWGIGFIPLDLSMDLGIHQNLGPTLAVEAYQDSTLAFGYARKVGGGGAITDGDLGVGVTGKLVYRGYVGKDLPAPEFVVNSDYFSKKDANEGLTADADIGALYKLHTPEHVYLTPYFSAVARNVLDYGFKSNLHLIDPNSQEPPKLGRRLDLGSKFEGRKFWNLVPSLTCDVKDIGTDYWTWLKGLHVGAEVLWDVSWWLRGGYRIGMSQGYWTAGFSGTFAWFQLDLASWGEEMGTMNSRKENRRYALTASLDF
jgi:hypothetical protein